MYMTMMIHFKCGGVNYCVCCGIDARSFFPTPTYGYVRYDMTMYDMYDYDSIVVLNERPFS